VQNIKHLGGVLLVHFEQLSQGFAAEFDVTRSARLEGIVGPLNHLQDPKQKRSNENFLVPRYMEQILAFCAYLRWNRLTW
jgi:hypothetical protein